MQYMHAGQSVSHSKCQKLHQNHKNGQKERMLQILFDNIYQTETLVDTKEVEISYHSIYAAKYPHTVMGPIGHLYGPLPV